MASQNSERLIPPCADWLHDATRKLLPAAFAILFTMAASVVLVYSLSNHQPVPSSFVTGVAITFGVLITFMLIGNFLLYARMKMSLIRSASSSERSIIIEVERKPWYVKLRTLLEKIEDGPRNFIRGYALREASTRNSRERSICITNQNHGLHMVDFSQSEVRHNNPDPPLGSTSPVDHSCDEIDLERAERLSPRTSSHELDASISRIVEAGKTRITPGELTGARLRTEMSHGRRHQEHGLAASLKIPGTSTRARRDSLLNRNQDACQGQSPQAEIKMPMIKRSREQRSLVPGIHLTEEHSKSDYITIGFHKISISNISPCAAPVQQSGNTRDPRIMGNYTNHVSLGHATSTDDSNSLTSSTKTCYQGPSLTSSSSPELAPRLPGTERGSGASGFTSRLMENIRHI